MCILLFQSLKELDYIVREKLFLEKLVGIDFQDPIEKAFFTIGTFACFEQFPVTNDMIIFLR